MPQHFKVLDLQINWQSKNIIITKTMRMEDAVIQKPWVDTLFRGTKVIKLAPYLRLEFNIDFIHQGVSFCMHKDSLFKFEFTQAHFFLREITTVIVGILRQFYVEMWPRKSKFRWNSVSGFRVSKIIFQDICIKEYRLWGWGLVCTSMSLSIL